MSSLFHYESFGVIKIIDVDGFKNWKSKDFEVNGETFEQLIHIFESVDVDKLETKWMVELGYKNKSKNSELDKVLNNFAPDDCTSQMFFSELSKYTEPFNFIVYDTQFFYEGVDAECWQIYVKSKGEIAVDILALKKCGILDDISQNDDGGDE